MNTRTACILAVASFLLSCGGDAPAPEEVKVTGVKTEKLEYGHGEAVLEGVLAVPEGVEGPRPGVLVVHAWKGIKAHERDTVEKLARLGYVAFACDVYGKGIRPETTAEAGKQAGLYRGDRPLLRARVQAGLDVLREQKGVDPKRVAAIGFCFGGGAVLELARSGSDVNGVVSFHGNLDTPDPADANDIRARVLVLHGGADPHVPAEQVAAFEKEMTDAGVDFRFIAYEGAVHAFSDPAAGNDPSKGAAYDEDAARKSWEAMEDFFGELF